MAVPLRLATLHVWILNGNAVTASPTSAETINKSLFAEFVVFFVGDRLQPFVGSVFARDFKGEMRKPTVGCRPMPMLHVGRNVNDIARKQLHGCFAFFLIPSATGHAHQHLPAAFRGMVNVPIVAATRFESHIVERNLFAGNRSKVAIADEIFGVCRIRLADRKNHFTLESSLSIITCRIFCPHVLGQIKCSPRLRPTGIKAYMGDNLGNFSTGDSVLFCRLKMINKRVVRNPLTDKGSDGY